MKPRPSALLGLAVSVLIASAVLVATTSQTAEPQPPPGPEDDPAFGLFAQMCNECHDAQRIMGARRSWSGWEEVLTKMIDKGAKGSGDDFETVFGFLLRQYGRVNVNTAVPDEIVKILGLTKKEAEAIIAHRKANGPFADLDALKKVPNVDVKILDQHKDALAF